MELKKWGRYDGRMALGWKQCDQMALLVFYNYLGICRKENFAR